MKPLTLIKALYKAVFCKHKTHESSTCPFTEKTYETCSDCGKLISVMKTHA